MATASQLYGQESSRERLPIVQVSGLVMTYDSTNVIPYANIYHPRTGRGTSSDYRGWFSKAFLEGDTVVVSVIGFKNIEYVVPGEEGDRISVIFALEEEITQLADVEVGILPTEEIFKEAILAMNLTEDQNTVLRNSEPDVVRELMMATPLQGTPSSNYRYVMDRQFMQLQQSSGPIANPLLNPFAWGQFIKSLKKKKK